MIFLLIRWGSPVSPVWDVIGLVAVLAWIALVRASRPFLPEILMLEQCPLRSTDESVITAKRRSKSLHSPVSSDMSGRFITVSVVLVALFFSVLYTLMWARGIAIGQWAFRDLWVLLLMYPLALWCVAGISVLVRLLNYLDTRIRLEGWEVELAIRAEAIRQFGDGSDIRLRPPQPASRNESVTEQEIPVAEIVG